MSNAQYIPLAFELAQQFTDEKNYYAVEDVMECIFQSHPENLDILEFLGDFNLIHNHPSKAARLFWMAALVLKSTGGSAERLAALNKKELDCKGLGTNDPIMAKEYCVNVIEHSKSSRAENYLPSVMIASMTIPASSTIRATLVNGLDLKPITISNSIFPDDVVYPKLVTELHDGNCISDSHLPGTNINRAILKNLGIDRHVVHTRDPRSSLVSITRHVANTSEPERRFLYHPMITPGPEFFVQNWEWQVDWMLDNAVDRIIQWTEDWIDAGEATGSNILFTCFEQFNSDKEKFFRRILEFYQIELVRFDWSAIENTEPVMFNKGITNEWETFLTSRQLKLLTNKVSERAIKMFAWDY